MEPYDNDDDDDEDSDDDDDDDDDDMIWYNDDDDDDDNDDDDDVDGDNVFTCVVPEESAPYSGACSQVVDNERMLLSGGVRRANLPLGKHFTGEQNRDNTSFVVFCLWSVELSRWWR